MASTDYTTTLCPSLATFMGLLNVSPLQLNVTHQFNITDEVHRCPKLCEEALGQGNPDLSGIGMVISCTIQGVLTILLGPCLLAGYSFLPKRLQAKLRDLQHEFLVATSFLSISLSVATLVYFLETARPFELSFLYYLATMQFFALFTVWFTATRPYYNEPRMHSRNFFMICTGTFIYAVSTVLMFVTVFTGSAIPEFLSACVNYDVERSDLIRAFEGDWVMTARSAKGIITCVFTVAWIVGARVLLDFAHAWRCHQQLCTLIAGGAATAMIVFIVRMERSREMVRALVGQEDYVSDNWGLGHILTIFIWFPILLKLIWILVQTNRFTEPPISRRPDLEAAGGPLVRQKTS